MVHAGCVFVAGIHLSRTWTSGWFESVRWYACVHRLDLSLYSHPKEVFREWSQNPCYLQGKNPLYWKKLSPEDGTHDPASSRTASPTHYQRAIPAPLADTELQLLFVHPKKKKEKRESPTDHSNNHNIIKRLLPITKSIINTHKGWAKCLKVANLVPVSYNAMETKIHRMPGLQ